MAKSLICNFGTFGAVDNATYFIPIAGSLRFDASVHPTEAYVQIPIRTAGTLRRFAFKVATNTASGTPSGTVGDDAGGTSVILRKNGVDTALAVELTADQTGWIAVVADVAVAANDKFSIKINVPTETGTNTCTITTTMLEFEPTDSSLTVQILASSGDNPTLSTDSTTRHGCCGLMSYASNLNEAFVKLRMRSACTIKGLYAHAISNARTTDTTIVVRKNGASTSQIVTFGSTVSGVQEDVTHEDSFADGDDFNWQIATSTGGNGIVFSVIAVEVVSTNSTFPLVVCNHATQSQGPGVSTFAGMGGSLAQEITSGEDDAEIYPPFALTLSKLHYMVQSNTNAVSAATAKVRWQNQDSGLEASVATLTTGLISEASPTTKDVVADQSINFSFDNPDPAGTLLRTWASVLATVPSGGAVPVIENIYRQMKG